MRAQLDAQDARLPGGGVFDIKTRATVAIRYDPLNYEVSGHIVGVKCDKPRPILEKHWLLDKNNPRSL